MIFLGVLAIYTVIGFGFFLFNFNLADPSDVKEISLQWKLPVWQFVLVAFALCVLVWPVIIYLEFKDTKTQS